MTNNKHKTKETTHGFARVAAASPKLKVGNVSYNTAEIIRQIDEAEQKDASIILFPELSLTGYTLGDLFQQDITDTAVLENLELLKEHTSNKKAVVIVGLPFRHQGALYNMAAVLSRGHILGLVPKISLPEYKEFYEKRWFTSGRELAAGTVMLGGEAVPVGTDILFTSASNKNIIFGIEICEDLWTPLPPSSSQALAGATLLFNLSASNELVGKADYRRTLVLSQSARTIAGYIYASAGVHESTTDLVFSGHSIIAENGTILTESERFSREGTIVIADIDVAHCVTDRLRTTSFIDTTRSEAPRTYRYIETAIEENLPEKVIRPLHKNPFVSSIPEIRNTTTKEVFSIQTAALAKRLDATKINKAVIGISGGLDSTLALLVTVETFKLLDLPLENIIAITMPGFGTTKKTKSNAYLLAEAIGISLEEIDITEGCKQHFKDIGHDGITDDVTFENVQARYRTMILMDRANQVNGTVIGTGDLSETALGWCTFTGDHTAHYNINASVPKTLVQHIVAWYIDSSKEQKVKEVLQAILDTPISPELKLSATDEMAQKTEEIVGPYELHDFFLYHFIRWASSPQKILYLAEQAFEGIYPKEEIEKWLKVFIKRFFGNQWKRSVMPDGPKIGSVSLSPRGDWRMPSDADSTLWIENFND